MRLQFLDKYVRNLKESASALALSDPNLVDSRGPTLVYEFPIKNVKMPCRFLRHFDLEH